MTTTPKSRSEMKRVEALKAMEGKPREFMIRGAICWGIDEYPKSFLPGIHVIEIRALEQLRAELDRSNAQNERLRVMSKLDEVKRLRRELAECQDRFKTRVHEHQYEGLRALAEEMARTLERINDDYVDEGTRKDCPGCDYDGDINPKHHPGCVYVIAKKALAKWEKAK